MNKKTDVDFFILKLQKFLEKLPTLGILLGLTLICILSNSMLYKDGLALHDSDQCIYSLVSECLRNGEWLPMGFSQGYGGTVWTWFRLIWVEFFTLFTTDSKSFISAHIIFSYFITPLTWAILMFFAARAYFSKGTAIIAGIIAAVGFRFWFRLGGIDYYTSLGLFGAVFIWVRAKYENPLFDMTRRGLFLMAIFTGMAVYVFRANLVFVAMFYFPWHLLAFETKRMWSPTDRLEKILKSLILVFTIVFLYLKLFGSSVGFIGAKEIILHAMPNLKFAALLIALYALKIHWKEIKREHFFRVGILIDGAFIGFLPEYIYLLGAKHSMINWKVAGEADTLRVLFMSMDDFLTVIFGNIGETSYTNVIRNFSLVLFICGVYSLIKKAKTDTRFLPIIATFIISYIAYLNVFISGPGGARYMFPMVPVIVITMAVFWENVYKTKYLSILAFILLALHLTYQIQHKIFWAKGFEKSGRTAEIYSVAEKFEKTGVKAVLSDSYWLGGQQYTLVSRLKVIYVPKDHPWNPNGSYELSQTENHVGILLTGTIEPDEDNVVKLLGRKFKIKKFAQVGKLELYIGDALPEYRYEEELRCSRIKSGPIWPDPCGYFEWEF